MVYFSPSTREITAKIVYYGPGMCGKTTNLQKVHELMAKQMKTDLVSVATETDRTIYFDFLPVKLGKIAGCDFVVRSFTVPGQPYYAETRKMVLQGADGVVFVADSQRYMLDQNKDSLLDLKRNLKANGLDYRTIPLVMQWNKRDLPDLLSVQDMEAALNDRKVNSFEGIAFRGKGVVETLKAITMGVFKHVRDGGLNNLPTSPGGAAPRAKSRQVQPRQAAAGQARQPAQQRRATPSQSLPQPPRTPTPVPGAPVQRRAAPAGIDGAVAAVISGAQEGAPPMPSKDEIGHLEFQNLAVLHHKLQERVAQLEKELKKLAQEHSDLKRIVGRKLL
ncbi:MAG: GTPase [Deltaproteobacteria bacterium]|nr:GTPase [Deltaproteobacteria bacterium]